MHKKTIIIISSIIALIVIVIVTCVFEYHKYREIKRNEVKKDLPDIKKNCTPFTGGSFTLKFDVDGGEEISDMSICIACSPSSYKDIPIPVKEGYKFLGWFSDKEFTNRITFTNTKEFKSVPKYDKNKCMIGYEDITIYAKWDEVQMKVEENAQPEVVEDNVVPENTISVPEVSTTRIYRPANGGYVLGSYGPFSYSGHSGYNLGIVLHASSGQLLYPINDGVVLGCIPHTNNAYRYVLYRTIIDGSDYYVLYYSLYDLNIINDNCSNNKNIKYDEPLMALSYNTDVRNAVPGSYNVMISPIFMNGDYKSIATKMLMDKNVPRINPGIWFHLNQGDSFEGR